jgi:hypothetical protein
MRVVRFGAILCVLVLFGAGCFDFVQKSGGAKIPSRPILSADGMESVRQEAQLADDLAKHIRAAGTVYESRESVVLSECTDNLLRYTGKPVESVSVADTIAVSDLHGRFTSEFKALRQDERDWEAELKQLQDDSTQAGSVPGFLTQLYRSATTWFWVGLVALVALCVIFPAAIPGVVSVVWNLVKLIGHGLSHAVVAVGQAEKVVAEEIKKKKEGA